MPTEFKGTPGPWLTEVMGHTLRVTASDETEDLPYNSDIALIGDCTDPQNQADARLIAAAPELLEALKEFAFVLNYQSIEIEAPSMANELNAAKKMAIAAIAKATGQPPSPTRESASAKTNRNHAKRGRPRQSKRRSLGSIPCKRKDQR